MSGRHLVTAVLLVDLMSHLSVCSTTVSVSGVLALQTIDELATHADWTEDRVMTIQISPQAIFDPHCRFLPALSAANPGKRIDFVANPVAQQHPDQFAPCASPKAEDILCVAKLLTKHRFG